MFHTAEAEDVIAGKITDVYFEGGIKEEDMPQLNPVVDGYGIGTSISNAPVVDYAMDIMEVEGRPLAKRGKWSGSKRALLCPACQRRAIVPNTGEHHECKCGASFDDILVPVLDNGNSLVDMPSAREIRDFVLLQTRVMGNI